MKKTLLISVLAMLLTAVSASGEPVSREQAQKTAEAFLKEQKKARRLSPASSKIHQGSEELPLQESAGGKPGEAPYYVFDKGTHEGFIIVSGDDQTVPILGYCDQGEFNYDQLPPAMQELLDDYARQIRAIQQGARPNRIPPNHPYVEPFMTCKWDQTSPYNDLCPLDDGKRSVTGCAATALAQVLYYQRDKSVTETTAAIPGYTTKTKQISVPGIEAGAPIDWANMKDTYNSASDLQKRAVAQLMLYCGMAIKMDYTNSSSGAYTEDVADALKMYFGYGNSVKLINTFSSEDEQDKLVYNELAAGRPVYLTGFNVEGGHAFVACGYENLRYYINWGWGGQSDGYYYLTNLTPGDGQGIGGSKDGYNSNKAIIIGLEPDNIGEKAMTFADSNVKRACLANWDADGDGKLTYNEAAAVTTIGETFKGNTLVKTFPELYYFTSLREIAPHAFEGCTQLTSIRLPKRLVKIGEGAFKNCTKLPQINLPTGIDEIGSSAFDGCKVLTAIELPDGVTAIEDAAFRNCASISSINLPVNIVKIGQEAFAGCTKLTSFTVNTYLPERIVMSANIFDHTDLGKAELHVLQGTKDYFQTADQWKDFGSIVQTREISGGKFAELESGKTYYLYHLGTGRYLTRGEAYKTQAVVSTDPMRFKLVHPLNKDENIFYITSPDTGNEGKYLFRTSNDGNVGAGINATFVDGRSLNDAAYWSIKESSKGIYIIQKPADSESEKHLWLGVQTDHESNAASPTYGVYWDVSEDAIQNCMWKLVPYDELSTKTFNEAETLAKLLAAAKKQDLGVAAEQAVYDNLDSSIEELLAAQNQLRKKLKFVEFHHQEVREKCISYFDTDKDGELSYKEASEVSEFDSRFIFKDATSLVNVEELKYFTNAKDIQGNFMQGCTNLETVVVPKGVEKIYYYAFKGCRKLAAINIPEYVNLIGEDAFEGCTALRTVTVMVPNPQTIKLGNNVFGNVPLAKCTLKVPFGSKALYEKAPVWKNFGQIVEIRGYVMPKTSPLTTYTTGYVMNIATRKYITMGEAYGTQSVVARNGRQYQFQRNDSMDEGVYFFCDQDGHTIFRTSTDGKVGNGVKSCFGDGKLTEKAYWKLTDQGDNTFTLQVPPTDATHVADEYLGVDESHTSGAASPTYGLYWDVKGSGTLWAFVTDEDLEAAMQTNALTDELAELLARAAQADIDVNDEQATYDNVLSTSEELQQAVQTVRRKLHYIEFSDKKVRNICLQNWDSNADGELSQEEAAAVTSIGEVFSGHSTIRFFEELRYFTSLTELPQNAFRKALSLHSITLPAGITAIGEYAFTGCNLLKYIVMLSEEHFVPMGVYGLPSKCTLFVPASKLNDYQNDPKWADKCRVLEYTGKPVVTAEASRQYGRTAATINVLVTGAPVEGEAECRCDVIGDRTLPAGTYPIAVLPGTITNQKVELREGVFTVVPVPLTITATSYTRKEGQPNPEFEVTYKGFRNGEKANVLTQQPVVTCTADAASPAGKYEITVSGAEAANYTISYVPGILTVETDPTGIGTVATDPTRFPLYDLQGRKVTRPGRRIYIQGRRKIVPSPQP